MEILRLEVKLRDYLETLSLVSLRTLARYEGMSQVCVSGKEKLIEDIVDVLTGKVKPSPRSKRGAPAKQSYLDPSILCTIDDIKRSEGYQEMLTVSSGEPDPFNYGEHVYSGVLEITGAGYGFLRSRNCQPSTNGEDVFLAAPVIHALRLRHGDFISCTAHPRQKNDSPAMDKLLTVNGRGVGEYEQRALFDNLTAQYANEKICLSKQKDLSLRVLDLFAPIGKGQRALIIAPPKAGKTTLLKNIAQSIMHGEDSTVDLVVLLIDERPEEVTDFRMSVPGAKVISSTFDEGAERHIRAADLTIANAKRLAELGRNVVVLLDSLTKLTRAYNYVAQSTGKTLSGGLEAGALTEPKRFFGAARNTIEKGSITILATVLVDTGSRMDDVIYEEFKGTGNADIFLSRELAERRVFPAIDIRRSGTRKEELLLSKEELAAVYKMRERGLTDNVQGLYDMMKKTADNAEFIARLPEWIKIFKNS